MPIDTNISSADNPLAPDNSAILAIIGPSESGTVGLVYQLSPGQEPYDSLGGGWLSEDASIALDRGATVVAVPATTTAGSIGTVTKSSTGPAITLSGTPLLDLPLFTLQVKTAGDRDGGAAVLSVLFDGSSPVLDVPIPPAPQATLIGTVDLTALTLSTLDTETLLLTPDDHAEMTVTFAAVTTIQDILDQINAVAVAATSAMRASLSQGKFLKITSGTHGTGSTLACNATSTADSTLGISNTPAAGAAATTTLPYTGIVLTFATGTYVLDETYTAAIVGPSCSESALMIAADALRSSGVAFGQVLINQPTADGAALRVIVDALGTKLAGWQGGAETIFENAIVAGPLGTTGDAGIQANDNDVKAAMLGHVDRGILVAHGDNYQAGHKVGGSHRRSPAIVVAARLATKSLSKDPGYGAFGPLEGANLNSPDGVTKARNEATATVKMGGSTGPGFTVLTTKSGSPYVVHGVTRAGPTSRFVHVGVLRATYRAATVLFFALQAYENWDPLLAPNGTMRNSDADTVESALNEVLGEGVLREPNQHLSDAFTAVDRTEVIANTNDFTVDATLQMKGQAENIRLRITTAGVLTLPQEAA